MIREITRYLKNLCRFLIPCISASIILILVANYWFIFALIPLMGVVYFIVRYYLTTSIEIRRIEAISKLLPKVSLILSILLD